MSISRAKPSEPSGYANLVKHYLAVAREQLRLAPEPHNDTRALHQRLAVRLPARARYDRGPAGPTTFGLLQVETHRTVSGGLGVLVNRHATCLSEFNLGE